jgi:hypothetical protein
MKQHKPCIKCKHYERVLITSSSSGSKEYGDQCNLCTDPIKNRPLLCSDARPSCDGKYWEPITPPTELEQLQKDRDHYEIKCANQSITISRQECELVQKTATIKKLDWHCKLLMGTVVLLVVGIIAQSIIKG